MRVISEETKDGYKYKTYDNGVVIKQLATAIENGSVEPESTDAELIQAELLLGQQEMKAKQESIDETLAALLLSQQK